MTARKDLLRGSRDEVSALLEERSRGLIQHEYAAGRRLRLLAVELSQRPNLKVSLVTYENESQELEITFAGDWKCDPIMIDRDSIGENCQVTWDRWLPIRSDSDIKMAADMVANVLNTCARLGASDSGQVIAHEGELI
jgi:hypothetical protein